MKNALIFTCTIALGFLQLESAMCEVMSMNDRQKDIADNPAEGDFDLSDMEDTDLFTPFPRRSDRMRPWLNTYESMDYRTGGKTANVKIETHSDFQFTIEYEGLEEDAYGGLYVSYDLSPDDDIVDTINLYEAFPNGEIVFRASSSDMTGSYNPNVKKTNDTRDKGDIVFANFMDVTGYTYNTYLGQIDPNMRSYRIPFSFFEEDDAFDMTRVEQIILGFQSVGHRTLNVEWGGYDYVTPIDPNMEVNSEDVTPLQPTPLRNRPVLCRFDSAETVDGYVFETAHTDVDTISAVLFTISYVGLNKDSYGGVYIKFDDDPWDGQTDFIDFNEVFPNDIIIGLSSPDDNGDGVADLTKVLFGVTDATGLKSKVLLRNLTTSYQYYVIRMDAFDPAVDFQNIEEIIFVFEGRGGRKVNVEWGGYSYVPEPVIEPS